MKQDERIKKFKERNPDLKSEEGETAFRPEGQAAWFLWLGFAPPNPPRWNSFITITDPCCFVKRVLTMRCHTMIKIARSGIGGNPRFRRQSGEIFKKIPLGP
jgi:hypothetical protein